jgi:exosortase
MLVLYAPTLFDLLRGLWSEDGQMHGPAVLGISVWLMYRNWPAMQLASEGHAPSAWGWPLLATALLLYATGRSQGIDPLEAGSIIWMLIALLLLLRSSAALKSQWFALFFMLFMIPLPGTLVAMVTLPMKIAVSNVAEHVLFWAGYPISRSGVILQIGQYMLMVADACAGLHTLLSLEAV